MRSVGAEEGTYVSLLSKISPFLVALFFLAHERLQHAIYRRNIAVLIFD
jgi:hypothetical protein